MQQIKNKCNFLFLFDNFSFSIFILWLFAHTVNNGCGLPLCTLSTEFQFQLFFKRYVRSVACVCVMSIHVRINGSSVLVMYGSDDENDTRLVFGVVIDLGDVL